MSKKKKELITQTELLIALVCLIIISAVAIIYNSMPAVFAGRQPAGQMAAAATSTRQFACGTITFTNVCEQTYRGGRAECREGSTLTASICSTRAEWAATSTAFCAGKRDANGRTGARRWTLGSACAPFYRNAMINCRNGTSTRLGGGEVCVQQDEIDHIAARVCGCR